MEICAVCIAGARLIFDEPVKTVHRNNTTHSHKQLLYILCRKSNTFRTTAAKPSASSWLLNLTPYTCREWSLHWWNTGVAWLYFSPLYTSLFSMTWNYTNTTLLIYIYKAIGNCAISSTAADWIVVRLYTHMNRVGQEHENSRGPMSIALC